jgi:hypothetical protein
VNDEEYGALKAKLEPLADKWKSRLNLENWYIEYFWHRSGLPDDEKGALNLGVMARIECDWRYLFAQVHFNMPRLIEADDDRIENAIVHEFMHCIVDEIARPADEAKVPGMYDRIEHVTSMLANIVLWSFQRSDTQESESVSQTEPLSDLVEAMMDRAAKMPDNGIPAA